MGFEASEWPETTTNDRQLVISGLLLVICLMNLRWSVIRGLGWLNHRLMMDQLPTHPGYKGSPTPTYVTASGGPHHRPHDAINPYKLAFDCPLHHISCADGPIHHPICPYHCIQFTSSSRSFITTNKTLILHINHVSVLHQHLTTAFSSPSPLYFTTTPPALMALARYGLVTNPIISLYT